MLVLIYAIMAVAVFAAVNIFFWKISFDLDKEMREEMRKCGDCYIDTDEARFGKSGDKGVRIYSFDTRCVDVVGDTVDRRMLDAI